MVPRTPSRRPAPSSRALDARRARRVPALASCAVSTTVLALALVAGCGRDEFDDRTARVALGGRTTTFELDSCGLDGTTAYVVGRSDDGTVLQAVVGVEGDDGTTGVPASTGLTVAPRDTDAMVAFGAEAWTRRGESGEPPGRITSARIRGSRIQAEGEAVPVDDDGRPLDRPATANPVDVSLDARCDDPDEG